jgi:PKD repeat protein
MVRRRGLAALVAAVFLGGCVLENQTAPPLSGPSGFGRQLRMTATPDTLPRDGSSQSVIRMTYTDHENKPLSRRVLLTASSGSLSVPEVTTDASGQAVFSLTAPGVNTNVGAVVVTAIPVASESDGADGANIFPQRVQINVLGPEVDFTVSPATPAIFEIVTFDASKTKLEGATCGQSCSYSWDFGDGTPGTGQVVQHVFQTSGVQNVTLTVSAGVASSTLTKQVVVAPPAAPVADFVSAPATPAVGVPLRFTSTTQVGPGATIVSHVWDFGDGITPSIDTGSTSFVVIGGYGTQGTFNVTLRVTDNLGRQSVKTNPLTVVP